MSGVLVAIGVGDTVQPARRRNALARLDRLGDTREEREGPDFVVAVSRMHWQLTPDFAGSVHVLEEDGIYVAADATVYEADRLRKRLEAAGARVEATTPSHLLLAGYKVWGTRVLDELRADFSFVVWDSPRRRLFAARDVTGSRPLFWTAAGEGIAVSSSCGALAELTGRAGDLNPAAIGAQAVGLLMSCGTDTVYRGVQPLAAGHYLEWTPDGVTVERYWKAPDRDGTSTLSFDEAAEELRMLVRQAAGQRLGSELTTVWMSGGWDSTAVFGAGQDYLRETRQESDRLKPVSMSYPEDDPGYEDDLINDVASAWGADVHWVDSEAVTLFDDLEGRAGRSDEPPAHTYEMWNRSLARGTRDSGSRIALDGGGGDQLFQVSDILMSDLLRRGAWRTLGRHVRARRHWGFKYLARYTVRTQAPDWVNRVRERVTDADFVRHYMELTPAPWVRHDFLEQHDLRERELAVLPSRSGRARAQAENIAFLTLPVCGWSSAYMRGSILRSGVEIRSPLLDVDVINFALKRPLGDRSDRLETKRLLRRAMEGLLPERVLAPRTRRTGVTSGLSTRRMTAEYPALLDRLFSEPLRLADMGIVDPVLLKDFAQRWREGKAEEIRVELFYTIRTEFWLRGLERDAEVSSLSGRPGIVSKEAFVA